MFYGFKYNLSLDDVLSLTLEEFNIFLKAQDAKQKEKEKNIIKAAYYTAAFNNGKKLKSLDYYLKQIDDAYYEDEEKDENKGLDFAKKQFEKYEKLRKGEMHGKDIKSKL